MSTVAEIESAEQMARLVRERLIYQPETGEFVWREARRNGVRAGDSAGTKNIKEGLPYRYIQLSGRKYQAHRLAWLYVHGEWPSSAIDHINGNGLDNRIANLRLATPSQNRANSRLDARNTSGAKGVSWNSRELKWQVFIGIEGKNKSLGLFSDKEAAAEAYRRAATARHGAFARLDP